MSLLVVGSVAYDSVETVHGKVDRALGGSATFFSMASSLFARTHLVAVVGDDFAHDDVARLERRGVDLAGLERVPGKTFRWGGRYSTHFETRESLFTELNVFSEFRPKLHEHHTGADLLFLANIHPTLQLGVLQQMKRPRFVGLDTMNFWIAGERAALTEVLRHVDALFVNDEEAFQLSGVGAIVPAARKIMEMGPSTVVVKRGEHGAVLFHGGHVLHMPAVLLDRVVDPTGAGDTFAGGFMGYLASQPTIDVAALQGAMVVGTLAASVCVEGFSVDALERANLDTLSARHRQLRAGLVRLDVDLQSLHARQPDRAAVAAT